MNAAPQILGELARLNRWELGSEARATLALLYQPVVQSQVKALIAVLPENGTPQGQEHRQAATLAQELSQELAYAWKLVFLDLEPRMFGFSNARARQNALSHLLLALSALVVVSFRTYTLPPANTWKELHQVFQALSDKEGSVASESLPDNHAAMLEAAYKRALLLVLADPFRFTRTEIEATLAYLARFSALIELSAAYNPEKAVFLINVDADMPCAQTRGAQTPGGLSLDTQELGKHLNRVARKLKAGGLPEKLGLPEVFNRIQALPLIERLYQSWRGSQKRGFRRYIPANRMQVEAVCSIEEIYKLFSVAEGDSASQFVASAHWRVLNESASGVSITAQVRDAPQIRLGDPVALRLNEATGWTLGVIRWGKIASGLAVEAGIEKITPRVSAAVIRVHRDKPGNTSEPCLLIPANDSLQTGERLLLPCGLYAENCEADIWHDGQRRKVILWGLIEQSPIFDLVELIPYQ